VNVRKAVFAGSWYPAKAGECEQAITGFLDEFKDAGPDGAEFVGGIVPHAGWYFSGSIACNVIRRLKGAAAPDVVVVFGMHLHPGSSNRLMPAGAWETPFGDLPVAGDLAAELGRRFSFVEESTIDFTRDNTIELQLPFIKYFFPDARVLAMGVPPAESSLAIGRAVVDLARDMGIALRVIGSTDLTHYGMNYGFTPQGRGPEALKWVTEENDRRVIEAMGAMDAAGVIRQGVDSQNACCAGAAAAAIAAGRRLGAEKGETLAYATSHDKSPGESFVGYVGMLF
jgi:MEMO1 family protein